MIGMILAALFWPAASLIRALKLRPIVAITRGRRPEHWPCCAARPHACGTADAHAAERPPRSAATELNHREHREPQRHAGGSAIAKLYRQQRKSRHRRNSRYDEGMVVLGMMGLRQGNRRPNPARRACAPAVHRTERTCRAAQIAAVRCRQRTRARSVRRNRGRRGFRSSLEAPRSPVEPGGMAPQGIQKWHAGEK